MSQENRTVIPARRFARAKPTTRDTAVTILTSGCHFNGKLYCRGSSRIGGRVEGHIISEGLLVIEEGASIEADVVAEDIVIQGTVTGRVEAKNRLELASTCSFDGELTTPILSIQEGARFNGRANMAAAEIGEGNHPKLVDMPTQDNHVPEVMRSGSSGMTA